MGTEGGRAPDALAETLFEEPYRFEFFQAVRLLERLFPEREPVGRSGGAPAAEVVRFRTRASLEFPASQIQSLVGGRADGGDDDDDGGDGGDSGEATGERPEMFVNFMGLTGPSGTLPHHYTELLVERARYHDTAYWEFLDIFNHRLISLFYRAWEKYRFHIAYERGGGDRFTEYLFDIIGLGTGGLKRRLGVKDEGLLFYGGLVAQRPHSASAVAAMFGDYYGVPVEVEQFTGQWLALDADGLTRLGVASSDFGINTVAGARVWDSQSKFRLAFGPLTLREFVLFLPGGAALDSALKITRLLVGLEFDFDVALRLRAEEVPESRLGGDAAGWPRLGWTSWLKTVEFAEGADPRVVLPVRE